MKLKGRRVTEILGTRYPIIQAPMSWVTDASLVAAVSNSGGLGVFGPGAGHEEPSVGVADDAARIRAQIRLAKALTDKPFGLNILLTSSADQPLGEFSEAWLEVGLEEGVRHFATVGHSDKATFRRIKEHGGVVIHRPLTPTIRNMQQAEAHGADILVATGYDEGGHIPEQSWGTFTVVPAMVDAVTIPVLAAGGINDRRGVLAAFALGAEGVYVGTRFIATAEAPAAMETKQLIVASSYDDIVYASPFQRSIRTKAADRLATLMKDPSSAVDLNAEISKLGGARPAMRQGKLDEGIVTVNTGIDSIRDIPTVAELIERLIEPIEIV